MNFSIRKLTESDIEQADLVLQAAFNRTENAQLDLKRYLSIQPGGWFLAEQNSRVVGLVGAMDYGTYAYIGYLAVLPEFQHQGIGRRLFKSVLECLDQQGCPMMVLDASDKGAPLYIAEGFEAEGGTAVYVKTEPSPKVSPGWQVERVKFEDIPALVKYDKPIFGADREIVLRTLLADFPDRAFLTRAQDGRMDGFLFAHPKRIGPFVADNREAAKALLEVALTLEYQNPIRIIAPMENLDAAQLFNEFGFELYNPHQHMRKGGSRIPGQRNLVYAQTGFTIG